MAVSAITDFRIQVSLFTNRKFRRLRSALGPGACMALVELWGYAAANEPDGALLGWSPDDVEVAANWDGMRGVFTQNLVELHWLDPADGGGYLIHDWAENQPWIADAPKRSAHAKKAIDTRWERERAKRVADGNDPNAAGIQAQYDGNTPSPPSPSPPKPLPSKPKTTRAQAPAVLYRWEEFAAIYPPWRLKPDKAAKAWWGSNAKTDATVDAILAAVRGWLKSEQWQQRVVPNCSKFLDEGIWQAAPGPPRKVAQDDWFKITEPGDAAF